MPGVNITWPRFLILPPLQKIWTVLPVPQFLGPELFSLCDATSPEGVDSQVRWWCIRMLLAGAAVTGTDRLSIYPFTGVLLAFSSFLYFYFYCLKIFLNLIIFLFYLFSSFLFCLFLVYLLMSFLKFSFVFFRFFIFYFFYSVSPHFYRCLFLSSWPLSHLSMRPCNVYR